MKILYSLLFCSIFSFAAQAQAPYLLNSLTFEDTTVINQLFYTDSILDPQGIWQIGAPQKSFLDSALSQPDGVVTLLDSLLPASTKASFIINIPDSITQYQYGGFAITFAQRYQFDSAHSGGYIEFSPDSGASWFNIANDNLFSYSPYPYCLFHPASNINGQQVSIPTWWASQLPTDTSVDGIPYFTGADSIWKYDTIVFPVTVLPLKTNQLTAYMLRFTVFSDSLSLPTAGWEIDNINLVGGFGNHCSGGIDEINSSHLKIFPDPVTDAYEISILNEHPSDYIVTVYDLYGRAVQQQSFSGQQISMHRSGMSAGSYFIRVLDTNTQASFEKRVVFE